VAIRGVEFGREVDGFEEDVVGLEDGIGLVLLGFVVLVFSLYFGGAGSFFDQKLDFVGFVGIRVGFEDVLYLSFLGLLGFSDLLYV
jgi:hypothetical protein